ncbi:DUF4190 domain-containing protein [Specibacter sp. AOP5-B1-6]|uniref:DUF4190 domain-containing protein n=1 Tax=Specibacter sp. AOP5-B1-6 TaxID=3457653 RepID=UPI00402BD57C
MTQNPENPYGKPSEAAPSYSAPAPYGQPGQGAPYGATAEDPGKTLGIVGLVLCFVVPLAGLIVSIIAKKKSQVAGFMNNTPAKVGVILGWIFTIVGFIIIVIYIIAFIALLNSGEMTPTTY